MATPANRVPVRVARGTLANLTAGLADLKEGEVVYVTDEDRLYVKEGGVLVATAGNYVEPLTTDGDIMIRDGGADTRLGIGTAGQVLTVTAGLPSWEDATGGGGGGALNDLTDVDTVGLDETSIIGRWTTNNTEDAVPGATGEWMNKSYGEVRVSATDSDGRNIVDGAGANDWPLTDTVGTFYMVPDGNFALTTPCTYDNTGEQTDYTTYFRVDNTSVTTWDGLYSTLAIYNTNPAPLAPTDGQVLAWSDANSDWRPSNPAINDLSDVDTATSAPLDGQALLWNTTDSEWQPGTVATALPELSDVKDSANPNLNNWDDNVGGSYPSANGQWRVFTTTSPDRLQFYRYNALGEDQSAAILTLTSGSTIEVSADNTNWTAYTTVADAAWNAGGGGNTVVETFVSDADGTAINALGETIYVRLDIPAYVTDGQVLTWSDANSQWEPADATGGGGGATTLDELTDVTGVGNYVYDGNVNFATFNGGVYFNFGSSSVEFRETDDVGTTFTDETVPQVGTVVEVSADGGSSWIGSVTVTALTSVPSSNSRCRFSHDGPADWPNGLGGLDGTITGNNQDIQLRWTQAPADGKVLTWVAANSQWEPADASIGGITNLTDVDTSTVAPTDGQVLTWDNADSEWQPANADPMTTDGDMIYRTGGASTRLARGLNGQMLAVVNDTPTWQSTAINDLSDVATIYPGDPDFASVSLLLDGTDFVDKSSNGLTVTNRNSATTLDVINYKFSPSSYDFNGDVIEVDNDPVLDLSTGDWTIEFFAYSGLSIGTSTYFFSLGDTSDTGACWAIRWINGIQLQYRAAGTTATLSNTSNFISWTTGTWHHIAVSRSGDNVYMFYDGADVTPGGAIDLGAGFATDTPGSSLWVGARKSLGSVSGALSSLDMEQFRITKGVARYTTAFTVPEEAYPQAAPVTVTDGQFLTWVDANSKWEPTDLSGTIVRSALGIGEYADDAAAGTGGVASGAMYYNTTSSDYRLKS